MKLHLMSDLHLEFGQMHSDYEPPADAEVVLLPGDVGTGLQGVRWAAETFRLVPVIYVAGNHEFYHDGRFFSKHYSKMKEAAEGTSVHVLQNESVVVDGVRFVGTTLWTDMALYGDPYLAALRSSAKMNDYTLIMREPPAGQNWSNKPLMPVEVLRQHEIAMNFLMDELAVDHDGPTVVLTHHAPSEQSCLPEYRGRQSNEFYASNLDRLVEMSDVDLWAHGHVHQSKDYTIGETRVVTNPRGYVDDAEAVNPNFDPTLLLEV